MSEFDLVIFDCDGVLIDSEIISARMLVAELARLGLTIDLPYVERHFLGLSVEDRRYRFNTPLSDSAIRARIASFDWQATTLIGDFSGKTLRGVAELATLKGDTTDAGEVALSVDGAHRRRGIARRNRRSRGCGRRK